MSLESVVDITILTSSPGIARTGFGTIMNLTGTAAWAERVRSYTKIEEVLVDFAATTWEYKAAARQFQQSPKAKKVKFGRLAAAQRPTVRWTVGVALVANNTNYKVEYDGTVYTHPSGGSATNDNIIAGLVALIDPLADVTAVASGAGGSQVMVVTQGTAGVWKRMRILGPTGLESDAATYLTLAMDAVEPGAGLAGELNAIIAEDSDWYWLANGFNSKACNLAVAAWLETQAKFGTLDTQDSVTKTAVAGGSDHAAALKTAAYKNCALIFSPDNEQVLGAGLAGRLAPQTPGSYTVKFQQVKGATGYSLTSTHRDNVKNKNCNTYEITAGKAIIEEGKTPSGQFIDRTVGHHWFAARLREDVFQMFLDAAELGKKVGYSNAGFARVEARLRGVIQEGQRNGFFSSESEPTITMPRAENATQVQRDAREMPPIEALIVEEGAVHATKFNITMQP